MITGTITLNGINDAQLIVILQEKEKDPKMVFNPAAMKPIAAGQIVIPGKIAGSVQTYSNVILTWDSEHGLKVVTDILTKMQHPHAHSA